MTQRDTITRRANRIQVSIMFHLTLRSLLHPPVTLPLSIVLIPRSLLYLLTMRQPRRAELNPSRVPFGSHFMLLVDRESTPLNTPPSRIHHRQIPLPLSLPLPLGLLQRKIHLQFPLLLPLRTRILNLNRNQVTTVPLSQVSITFHVISLFTWVVLSAIFPPVISIKSQKPSVNSVQLSLRIVTQLRYCNCRRVARCSCN